MSVLDEAVAARAGNFPRRRAGIVTRQVLSSRRNVAPRSALRFPWPREVVRASLLRVALWHMPCVGWSTPPRSAAVGRVAVELWGTPDRYAPGSKLCRYERPSRRQAHSVRRALSYLRADARAWNCVRRPIPGLGALRSFPVVSSWH